MKLPYDHKTNMLRCPDCGSECLHHYKVEVFRRDREDATSGISVSVFQRGSALVGSNMSANPSARRDGMRIHFTCEQCPALSEMTVVQHKGSTYLNMEIVGHTRHDVVDDE